ncbi:hypothetical protein [Polyangium sp. y55x31]|uniref:hypothetical protein n=1 Tax=Polyangium sp. y55x31 TaxID=3042688 RepID=UPI0024821320|nr:hypothetical protein [Polyangium sp. y55x31]MDI1476653.1 hypothetical protein [Polyangium sp. y55x31]
MSKTKIFARDAGDEKQVLVYAMTLSTDEELAMVLALPVRPRSDETAVRFIDLSHDPGFFVALDQGFGPRTRGAARGLAAKARAPLAVVDVGSFEASYVPTIADFDRLDPRFRLPEGVWDQQAGQEDFGFAVFKLKPGKKTIHPMAFAFPRADPARLFFPTIHVHDGQAHPTAFFDHTLYYQRREEERPGVSSEWQASAQPARSFMNPSRCAGVVDPERRVYRRVLRGVRKNQDIYV